MYKERHDNTITNKDVLNHVTHIHTQVNGTPQTIALGTTSSSLTAWYHGYPIKKDERKREKVLVGRKSNRTIKYNKFAACQVIKKDTYTGDIDVR